MNTPKLSYFGKLTTSKVYMLFDIQEFLDLDTGIYQDPIFFYPDKLIELLSEVETELVTMEKDQIKRALLQLNRGLVTMKDWLSEYQKQFKTDDGDKVYAKAKQGKMKDSLNIYHFYVLSRALPLLEARVGEMSTEAGINIPVPKEPPADNPQDQLISEYLTTNEVAKLLKVTPRTIQNYRDQDKIPFKKIGRQIRYKRTDVMNLLKGGLE